MKGGSTMKIMPQAIVYREMFEDTGRRNTESVTGSYQYSLLKKNKQKYCFVETALAIKHVYV